MDAIRCDRCTATGDPRTMRWTTIDAEILDGDWVGTNGPVCAACCAGYHPDPEPDTMEDAGEYGPEPEAADFERLAGDEPADEVECPHMEETWVPWGSTMALVDRGEPCEECCQRAALEQAEKAWEDGAVEWALDPSDHTKMVLAMIAAPATNNETKGEA